MTVAIVRPGAPIPAETRLVIIPGSKSTIADLAFLAREGWDIDILAHRPARRARPRPLRRLPDARPDHRRSRRASRARPARSPGLGLLAVDTVLGGDKTTEAVTGRHLATGAAIAGYEIHLGRTTGADCARPLLRIFGRARRRGAVGRRPGRRDLRPRPVRRRRVSPAPFSQRSARRPRACATRRPSRRRSTRSPTISSAISTSSACSPSPALVAKPADRQRRQKPRRGTMRPRLRSRRGARGRYRRRVAVRPPALRNGSSTTWSRVATRAGEGDAEGGGHRRFRPAGVRRAVLAGIGEHDPEGVARRTAGKRSGERR